MLRSVEIKGLRGIREGKLADLTPLVVLVGPNGSGKSTILDAILIAANPFPMEGIGQTVCRREGLQRGFRWLLWKAGIDGPAQLTITADLAYSRTCTLSVGRQGRDEVQYVLSETRNGFKADLPHGGTVFDLKNDYSVHGQPVHNPELPSVAFIGPFPQHRSTPLHELYSNLARKGLRKESTALVADLLPGLEQMEVLTEDGSPVLYLDFQDRAVPAALAGDGVHLLIRLGFQLATTPGGIVLLEEPEIHMHPAAIRQAAKVIAAAVRRQVQVFITTHSIELLDALLSELPGQGGLNDLSVYRLQLQAGVLKSSRLAGPEAALARSTIEDDLR